MSVTGAAGADKSPVTGRVAALSRDVFAGLVTSLMSVAYGLSFAALIFAPPLTPWIAYGIAATFVTTTISAAIVAVRSSLPFAIAGPDGATAAVTASLVSALISGAIVQILLRQPLFRPPKFRVHAVSTKPAGGRASYFSPDRGS